VYVDEEMRAMAPLIELQGRWSLVPGADELLIEITTDREGHHHFLYPFEGRLVHEGLGSLLAYRVTRLAPRSVTVSATDYGLCLMCEEPLGPGGATLDEAGWRGLLEEAGLVEDLIASLNQGQLTRQHFRDIARIAGLIHPGYPGSADKPAKHLQASSEMFYDVFSQFDPSNLLLEQARSEVLREQLELERIRRALRRLRGARLRLVSPRRLTPMALPIWAERLRSQTLSSETWEQRIRKRVAELETQAEHEG
jgi:ATP-dependent Lhr-like helicase